jgi:biopolymer transport protein ExbD
VKFYTKRRAAPVVTVISLIDILTILLIFFIVTMKFPEDRASLKIDLPKSSGREGSAIVDNRLTIAVGSDTKIFVGEKEVALPELGKTLKGLRAENPAVKFELKADEKLPLGVLVGLWDAFNEAGVAIKDVPARILLQNGAAP